jgi:hypothetical protein
VDAVCQFKLPHVWARPVCSHSVVQGLCWPCVQSCVENKTFRYCEISGYGCSDAVSPIYTWSKNFSHSAYEKSGANMAGIDVQNKLPVHKIIVLFLKSMSKCQISAHSLPNLEPRACNPLWRLAEALGNTGEFCMKISTFGSSTRSTFINKHCCCQTWINVNLRL